MRYRVLVTGRVRGVGFRYHVREFARRLELDGFVANCSRGVCLEVEGPRETVDQFVRTLRSSPPPSAEVLEVNVTLAPLRGERGFRILPDAATGQRG